MIIYIDSADAYHEGGHAAMFWHYSIPLDYVSVEPDLVHGYGGVTVPLPRSDITGRSDLENEMRISAAGDAATCHIHHLLTPDAESLIRRFDAAVADLQADPYSRTHTDLRNFARAALARDDEFRQTDLDMQTGPSSWVEVWLEAEVMIRGKLWPAVVAVAEALIASTQPHCLDGEQAAVLMAAAMLEI
jgi:hypothetical protein